MTCPKSGGSLCYVMKLTPDVTTYMSLSCGFWSNSLMTKDSDFLQEQFEILPEIYKDLAWEDPNTELVWLPMTVNVPHLGMVFANGSSIENWKWASVQAKKVENESYEWKADMSTKKEYNENEFLEALDYIGIFESLNPGGLVS